MKRKLLATALMALFLSVTLSVTGCSEGDYLDGTYTGNAKGKYSDIVVEVSISRGRISEIEILAAEETPGMMDPVRETMIPEILETQGVEGVDTISGATSTSSAALEAIGNALAKAHRE